MIGGKELFKKREDIECEESKPFFDGEKCINCEKLFNFKNNKCDECKPKYHF